VTRKIWNDDAGKLATVKSAAVADPFAPIEPSERLPDPLSITCTDCNAKPGEPCGSLLPPFGYLTIPHYRRGRS
jgi:hypothetical protein